MVKKQDDRQFVNHWKTEQTPTIWIQNVFGILAPTVMYVEDIFDPAFNISAIQKVYYCLKSNFKLFLDCTCPVFKLLVCNNHMNTGQDWYLNGPNVSG